MIRKRTFGTVAAVGGLSAAIALLSGQPSARADDTVLQAKQQRLQSRIDQLAQVSPTTREGPVPVPIAAAGQPALAGAFPRSFLIPGTDVSLRVGGQGVGTVVWYIKGQAVGGAFNGQGG